MRWYSIKRRRKKKIASFIFIQKSHFVLDVSKSYRGAKVVRFFWAHTVPVSPFWYVLFSASSNWHMNSYLNPLHKITRVYVCVCVRVCTFLVSCLCVVWVKGRVQHPRHCKYSTMRAKNHKTTETLRKFGKAPLRRDDRECILQCKATCNLCADKLPRDVNYLDMY